MLENLFFLLLCLVVVIIGGGLVYEVIRDWRKPYVATWVGVCVLSAVVGAGASSATMLILGSADRVVEACFFGALGGLVTFVMMVAIIGIVLAIIEHVVRWIDSHKTSSRKLI